MKRRTLINLVLAVAAFRLMFTPAGAQYAILWSTIDGGGAASGGGGYTLNGTIGQPDSGAPMRGGEFTITGGFWVVPQAGPPPLLSIRLGSLNTVVLFWSNPSTGYQLQQSAASGWSDVSQAPVLSAGNKEVTLPINAPYKFFRLCKP